MKTLAKFFAVAVIFIGLQGCMTAAIVGGGVGVSTMSDTGEAKVVLTEGEGGKTNVASLQKIKSVVTNNEIAATYLTDYGVFKRVVLTSQQPLTNQKAAEVARANNVDGFLFSNPGGGSRRSGLVLETVVYGSVTTAIVDRNAEEVYRQKIGLERGALHAEDLLEREIIDALATAAVNDIKFAQNRGDNNKTTAKVEAEEDEGWLSKVNPFKK